MNWTDEQLAAMIFATNDIYPDMTKYRKEYMIASGLDHMSIIQCRYEAAIGDGHDKRRPVLERFIQDA